MTGAAVLTLLATVLTAEGMAVEIDLGTEDGVRVGDQGAIFYQLGEGEDLTTFEIGWGEVLDAGRFTAWLLVDPEAEIMPGYSVRLEIPAERLTRPPAPEPPAQRPDSPASRGRFVVSDRVTSCLNLRAMPSVDTERLDCLWPRTPVTGQRSLDAWMKVQLDDGRQGWVMERFLDSGGGGRRSPIAAAAPAASPAEPGGAEPSRLRRDLADSRAALTASEAERRELERRLAEAERQRDPLARQADAPPEVAPPRQPEIAEAPAGELQGRGPSDGEEELRGRLAREEALAADLGRQLAAAEAGLANAEQARRELEGRLEAANLERGALRQRVEDLETERGNLAAELEAARTELGLLRQESRATEVELRTRLEEREAAGADLHRQLELAQRALEASQGVQRRLAERLEGMAEDAEGLRSEADPDAVPTGEQPGSTVAELEQRLAATESAARDSVAARDAAAQRLEQVTQGRDALRARLTVLEGELAGAHAELDRLRLAGEVAARSGRTLEANLEEVSAERNGWRERAERGEALRRSLEAELERARAAAVELRRQVESVPGPSVETLVVGRRARPCLRVRAAPSMEAQATGCLPPGTAVVVIDLVPGWRQVGAGEGSEGWIAAGYLDSGLADPAAEGAGEPTRRRLEIELDKTRATAEELQRRLAAAPREPGAGSFVVGRRARPCLRVRAEPSAEAPATGCLEPGTAVTVVGGEPGWSRVRAGDGPEVWVAADYLESELDRSLVETEETLEEIEAAHSEAAARIELLAAERAALEEWAAGLDAERRVLASDLAAARAQLGGTPGERPSGSPDGAVEELEELVNRWAAAWSRQDAAGYLSHYSARFQPAAGMSRASWEARRREQLSAPESAAVELSDLEGGTLGPDRAWVRFVERYRSDSHTETVAKRLELVREDGAWKILEEKIEP